MFQEKVSLETPEHVAVEFEVAGPMSRFAAALFDGMILVVAFALLLIAFLVVALVAGGAGWMGDAAMAVGLVVMAVVVFGYFPLCEHFMKGQTPGKKALGLRVMRRDMAPLDFTSVLVRGILRIVDVLPGIPFPLVGMVSMTLSEQGLRLGDLAAGTWVVRDPDIRPLLDRKAEALAGARIRGPRPAGPAGPAGAAPAAPEGRLTAEEFRIAREFLERAPALDPEQRRAAAVRVASPILRRFGEFRPDAEAFLREEVARGSTGRSLL